MVQRNQKLDALARLAHGVAHDLNNVLTVIHGYSTLVLETGANSPFETIQKSVEEISRAATRASAITFELLTISRPNPPNLRPVILQNLVKNLERLLVRLIGEDIELVIRMDADMCTVNTDPGGLEKMIVNLAANARDAMPHGGTLTIGIGSEDDLPYGLSQGETAGPYAVLSVSDTGVGMDETIKSHLFEPYFTTKHGGTGLGLANVYGTVKQIGGEVIVESELGRGSTFQVYLPKVDEDVDVEGVSTILVVEDEANVRSLIVRELRALSYRVIEAPDPVEAFSLSRRRRGRIDLLLTDIVLPGFTGVELAEKVVSSRPDIKILYISGNAEMPDSAGNSVLENVEAAFLRKPFTAAVLAESVRQLLTEST